MAPQSSAPSQQTISSIIKQLCDELFEAVKVNNDIVVESDSLNKLKEALRSCRMHSITIPAHTFSRIYELLEEPQNDICCRLRTDVFSIILEIVLQVEPCRYGERVIYMLAAALHTTSESANSRATEKKKTQLGKTCLHILLNYLGDTTKPAGPRRWAGLLFLELFQGSDSNRDVVSLGPEQDRRRLGELLTAESNGIIQRICGQLIRAMLDAGIEDEHLWPVGTRKELYEDFPRGTLDDGWKRRFQEYLDDVMDSIGEAWEGYENDDFGLLYFVQRVHLDPSHIFGDDGSNKDIVVNENSITIHASGMETSFDQALEIPLSLVQSLATETYNVEKGGKPITDITLGLQKQSGLLCYLNSFGIDLNEIEFTAASETAKEIEDQLVSSHPDLRQTQLLSGDLGEDQPEDVAMVMHYCPGTSAKKAKAVLDFCNGDISGAVDHLSQNKDSVPQGSENRMSNTQESISEDVLVSYATGDDIEAEVEKAQANSAEEMPPPPRRKDGRYRMADADFRDESPEDVLKISRKQPRAKVKPVDPVARKLFEGKGKAKSQEIEDIDNEAVDAASVGLPEHETSPIPNGEEYHVDELANSPNAAKAARNSQQTYDSQKQTHSEFKSSSLKSKITSESERADSSVRNDASPEASNQQVTQNPVEANGESMTASASKDEVKIKKPSKKAKKPLAPIISRATPKKAMTIKDTLEIEEDEDMERAGQLQGSAKVTSQSTKNVAVSQRHKDKAKAGDPPDIPKPASKIAKKVAESEHDIYDFPVDEPRGASKGKTTKKVQEPQVDVYDFPMDDDEESPPRASMRGAKKSKTPAKSAKVYSKKVSKVAATTSKASQKTSQDSQEAKKKRQSAPTALNQSSRVTRTSQKGAEATDLDSPIEDMTQNTEAVSQKGAKPKSQTKVKKPLVDLPKTRHKEDEDVDAIEVDAEDNALTEQDARTLSLADENLPAVNMAPAISDDVEQVMDLYDASPTRPVATDQKTQAIPPKLASEETSEDIVSKKSPSKPTKAASAQAQGDMLSKKPPPKPSKIASKETRSGMVSKHNPPQPSEVPSKEIPTAGAANLDKMDDKMGDLVVSDDEVKNLGDDQRLYTAKVDEGDRPRLEGAPDSAVDNTAKLDQSPPAIFMQLKKPATSKAGSWARSKAHKESAVLKAAVSQDLKTGSNTIEENGRLEESTAPFWEENTDETTLANSTGKNQKATPANPVEKSQKTTAVVVGDDSHNLEKSSSGKKRKANTDSNTFSKRQKPSPENAFAEKEYHPRRSPRVQAKAQAGKTSKKAETSSNSPEKRGPPPATPSKEVTPDELADKTLLDDHIIRKPAVISFSAKGPRNQGLTTASVTKASKAGKPSEIAGREGDRKRKRPQLPIEDDEIVQDAEVSSSRKQKSDNIPQIQAPMQHEDEDEFHQVTTSSPPTQVRSKSSQGSRVNENGSPLAPPSIRTVDHIGKIKRNLTNAGTGRLASQARDSPLQQIVDEESQVAEPESPEPFGPKIHLSSIAKARPVSPEREVVRWVAHKKTRYGSYEGLSTKELIAPEEELPDPFTEQRSQSSSRFADRLRASSPRKGAPKVFGRDKKQLPRIQFEDPEKTLVDVENQQTSPSEMTSGESFESQVEEQPRSPLTEKDLAQQWNNIVRPYYSGYAESLNRWQGEMLTRIQSEEDALKSYVKAYHRNGTKMLDSDGSKHQSEKEVMRSSLDAKKDNMAKVYSDARSFVIRTADELKNSAIEGSEQDWKNHEEHVQKLIDEGMRSLEENE